MKIDEHMLEEAWARAAAYMGDSEPVLKAKVIARILPLEAQLACALYTGLLYGEDLEDLQSRYPESAVRAAAILIPSPGTSRRAHLMSICSNLTAKTIKIRELYLRIEEAPDPELQKDLEVLTMKPPFDMSEENFVRMNQNAVRIDEMSPDDVERLIQAGQCPYEPEHLVGVPLGMFHCPLCGDMVLAGCQHPRAEAPEP